MERFILCGALGRALVGPAGDGDATFAQRFGWHAPGPPPKMDELHTLLSALENETANTDSMDQAPRIFEFSRRELTLLVRVLAELAYGVTIPEWEFWILLGFKRTEAKVLLNEIHPLLVGEHAVPSA